MFLCLTERKSTSSKPSDHLDDLDARIKSAQSKGKVEEKPKDDGKMLGMAWRLSTELVVCVLVGTGLGYGLDKLFDTAPWLLLVGLMLGFAAGIRSVLRVAAKMDAENANVPRGEDIGFDEDDD